MTVWRQKKKNDELYHWGIKGMRWGIRRYQNEDGTLTPAGEIRYAKQKKKEKEKQEYEEALSIIDQQLKRIPRSKAFVSALAYSTPKAIYANGIYNAWLAKNVSELGLARSIFKSEKKVEKATGDLGGAKKTTPYGDPVDIDSQIKDLEDYLKNEPDAETELREIAQMELEDLKRERNS